MDNLFNNILANVSADITIGSAIITMLVAVVFGAAIGFTYYKTQEENYQRSMAVTLLMLPIILSVIIIDEENEQESIIFRGRFEYYPTEGTTEEA